MATRPKILVALPTYRGNINARTAICLIGLKNCPADFAFDNYDSASAAATRNVLASRFLAEPTFTHILMIDDDMIFRHQAITRMIQAGVAFIGVASPLRRIDLDKALNLARTEPPNKAVAKAMRFNIAAPAGGKLAVHNGIAEVEAIGAAISLITRNTFDAIIKSGVRTRRDHTETELKGPLYGFFDPFAEGDNLVEEDVAFCRRAKKAGIAIHAVIDETVVHAGQFMYTGKFSDVLS